MSSILLLRLTSVTWGLLSLLLAFMLFTGLSMLGFPDGYISPYDTATRQLQEVLAWLVVAQGAYFLLIGVVAKCLRPAGLLLQILVTGTLVFVPINVVESCPRWDSCTSAYQAITGNFMDDGTGG
ncbi:MAG: hypothetical protein JWR51_1658 [Devosia sp.]|uniref:hypothetical protein n=1 Tax=Devosia sp. TaxID=1871048 RepID=UPI002627468D|nr:hypothetical protein [Devosia sp.]MDB5528555.1 hypothetical protein [Devosia sp.]